MVEEPQVAVEEKPQVASSNLPEVRVELEAGAQQVARRANAGARLELELRRGAEVVARHEGRRTAVETPPVETPVESYPVYVPAESNDSTVDPAGTQA